MSSRLSLKVYPDPSLSTKCLPVEVFGQSLAEVGVAMLAAMREHGGVGLAANQVGIHLRLVAMGAEACGGADVVMANPSLVAREGECALEEGCLSLPGLRAKVAGRSDTVRVAYQDLDGAEQSMELGGLGALCIQHEIDHLDGLTMLDHLSPLKASRAKAKLAKSRRQ